MRLKDKVRYEYYILSQTDGQSKRVIQILEDLLRMCVLEFGGN
jgi:hypothetical protein